MNLSDMVGAGGMFRHGDVHDGLELLSKGLAQAPKHFPEAWRADLKSRLALLTDAAARGDIERAREAALEDDGSVWTEVMTSTDAQLRLSGDLRASWNYNVVAGLVDALRKKRDP